MRENGDEIKNGPGNQPRECRQAARWLRILSAIGPFFFAAAQIHAAPIDFHPVDLSALCAQAYSNSPSFQSWSALPRGAPTFDGIPFKVDGKLEVTGMEDARNGDLYPGRISHIPLGRKAGRLHLLHGADHEEKDGVPLATLVWHYANGEVRSFRVTYGVHVRSWARERREPRSNLADPESSLAWTMASPEPDRPWATLRLYHTVFENPLPDQEITHLEWISLYSRAAPFIAGLTLDPQVVDPAERTPGSSRRVVKKSLELEDSVYRAEFVIHVTEERANRPLTNASGILTITDEEAPFYFGEARADETGTLRLPYPPQQTVSFGVLVRAPSHLPFLFSGSKTNGGDFPRETEARLASGLRVGGTVNDSAGRPISGAEVILHKVRQTGPREYERMDYDTARTGEDGKWFSEALPADSSGFSFEVAHPAYRSMTYSESSPDITNGLAVSRDELRLGKAVMVLPPALRVAGVVLDDSGQAVTNAEVRLVESARSDTTRPVTCDREGRFSFVAPQPGEVSLMILARGCATKLQSLQIEPDLPPVTLTLNKVRPFTGRVVDQNQQPVPGARLKLDSWNGTHLLQWQALTDERGRFVWDSPPEGNVMLYVSATNHSSMRTSLSNPSGEHPFNLRKMSRVVGHVVDAETRKPLEEFTVVKGRTYNPDEPMRWERYDAARGRKGEYAVRLDDYSSGRSQVLVEAPGYLPAASPVFHKAGFYTNDFALKKGRGISGVVQLADGTPVANATVTLVERSDSAYMERPGELRRSGSGGDYQRSNASGRFEFAPKLEAHTIVAAHERGFAEVRASNVIATGKVILQPWGRVRGVMRVGRKVEPGQAITLQNAYSRDDNEGRLYPALSLYLKVDPDENGHFLFEKVPPGDRKVYLQYKLNERESGRTTASSHGVPVTVPPNATAEVTLGGSGRPVIGQIVVVGGDTQDVDWRRDVHMLQTQIVLPPDLTAPDVTPKMTEEEQRNAWQEYRMKQTAYWRSEKGRQAERAQRGYVLLFDTNGAFHIDSVPPGAYTLYVSPTNPERGDNYYESIGSLNQAVTVPEPPPGRPDEPFDLGEIELQIRGTLRVGRRAPRFETRSFDGKTIKLEDYQGKYVLLDFWATWAGTRSFDVQMLKGLHDTYGKDNRLVMLGLNFDNETNAAQAAIAQAGLKWTQCYAGPWNQTRLAALFGIQGLPDAVLIGPDGKIAAKNLRGSILRSTVRNVLAPPKAAGAKP